MARLPLRIGMQGAAVCPRDDDDGAQRTTGLAAIRSQAKSDHLHTSQPGSLRICSSGSPLGRMLRTTPLCQMLAVCNATSDRGYTHPPPHRTNGRGGLLFSLRALGRALLESPSVSMLSVAGHRSVYLMQRCACCQVVSISLSGIALYVFCSIVYSCT